MQPDEDLTLDPHSESAGPKKRLHRINTPHKMAIWIERMVYEVRDDKTGDIYDKAEATARLMRLLREIHADEILAKRQKDLEDRILVLQERLDAAERQRRVVQ